MSARIGSDDGRPRVSVVLPCLNESRTIRECIAESRRAMIEGNLSGEVIVADNGSTDDSASVAADHGARVINVPKRGYGSALRSGIHAACGDVVVMADADGSYNLSDIPRFYAAVESGVDVVIGNRFRGGIAAGAMPFLNRYVGNPVLTTMGRVLFRSPCRDFHCGMRAVRREAFLALELHSTGMEFASEMIAVASLSGLSIGEIATTLSPDKRNRPPHLRPFRDGFRHVGLMLRLWLHSWHLPGLRTHYVGRSTPGIRSDDSIRAV